MNRSRAREERKERRKRNKKRKKKNRKKKNRKRKKKMGKLAKNSRNIGENFWKLFWNSRRMLKTKIGDLGVRWQSKKAKLVWVFGRFSPPDLMR